MSDIQKSTKHHRSLEAKGYLICKSQISFEGSKQVAITVADLDACRHLPEEIKPYN